MKHTILTSKSRTNLISAISCSLGLALIGTQSAQALTIRPTSDGQILVDTILGNNSGIIVDSTSINFMGATGSSGSFTDGLDSGIGIESGILLTTGQALDAVGPNSSDLTGTVNINPSEGIDKSSLQFEFESTGGDFFLKYVFASDEYNEFDNVPFSDVLSILLDGQNIALVPGTNIPVSVNTINDGNFSELYKNNNLSNFNIEYDGFTEVFTAQFLGLTPGTHTLELSIADGVGDNSVDSAVFIAAGSLSDSNNQSTTVPEPTSIVSLLGIVLLGSTTLNKIQNKN